MNKAVVPIAIGVAGVGVGFTAGYIFAARRINKQVSGMIDELDAAYKDSLARATKTGQYATVQGAAEAVLQIPFADIQSQTEDEALPTPDEASNLEPEEGDETHIPELTDEQQSALNLAAFAERFKNRENEEKAGVTLNGEALEEDDDRRPTVPNFVTVRDPNGPYVISIDDYMDDDDAFTKQEMTFFEGDGILIDSKESIAGSLKEDRAGIDRVIGIKNLDRWGSGTTDPDQFYVRNERLGIEVEVTRDKGTYTRQVLGIKASEEIQRSMQKPLKMREADDQ